MSGEDAAHDATCICVCMPPERCTIRRVHGCEGNLRMYMPYGVTVQYELDPTSSVESVPSVTCAASAFTYYLRIRKYESEELRLFRWYWKRK